jgi:hypothetical protein
LPIGRVRGKEGRVPQKKKKGYPAIWTVWKEIKDNKLSEMSQAQKDKYCMLLLMCGMSKC